MKAKIKKTGEIVEVIKYSKYNHCIEYGNSFGEYDTKSLDDVDLIIDEPAIDWEQRRYEIAKEAMGAFISSPSYQLCMNNNYYDAMHSRPWSVAEIAVEYADALIEELKR